MKHIALALIAVTSLSACVAPMGAQREVQRPPFPVAEYQALERKGTATVTGQVIMRTSMGPRFGAAEEVFLNPVTSYSTYWYTEGYLGNKNLAAGDPRQDEFIYSTNADGSGSFQFDNVPAGDYYLSSSVRWSGPGQYIGQIYTYNEWIVDRVRVEPGARVQKILTRDY